MNTGGLLLRALYAAAKERADDNYNDYANAVRLCTESPNCETEKSQLRKDALRTAWAAYDTARDAMNAYDNALRAEGAYERARVANENLQAALTALEKAADNK